MSNNYLLLAILAMSVVTFITRALPVLVPKRVLTASWLHRLNERLPLTVLTLLLLSSLLVVKWLIGYVHQQPEMINSVDVNKLVAQLVALMVVLLVYHYSRQLLVSMIVGIATINAMLWLL